MVDEITDGFEDLELDHPTGEGETRLGSSLKTPCLWRKELINLPNWTPPPPPPKSPPKENYERIIGKEFAEAEQSEVLSVIKG